MVALRGFYLEDDHGMRRGSHCPGGGQWLPRGYLWAKTATVRAGTVNCPVRAS